MKAAGGLPPFFHFRQYTTYLVDARSKTDMGVIPGPVKTANLTERTLADYCQKKKKCQNGAYRF